MGRLARSAAPPAMQDPDSQPVDPGAAPAWRCIGALMAVLGALGLLAFLAS